MKKIIIEGSAKFYNEVIEYKQELEKNNYMVINYPKKIDVTNENEYKKTFENYYQDLDKSDDFLLLNLDKNGIKGYIGYESFAELVYVIVKNIKTNKNIHNIYILQMPSKEVGCYDEIVYFMKLGYIKLFENKNIINS